MIKGLLQELKNSAFSVLPIYLIIMLLLLCRVISLTGMEILNFSLATIFVIFGLTLFNYGAENAMKPIGKSIGKGLTKKGKIALLILSVFVFGFVITIAEPDLAVLANQTSSIFNKWVLIIMVGLSVGFFLVVAILKIIKKISLTELLGVFYLFAFALVALLCYQGKESILGLAFDSGGVTTGPMTVPFLMALGAGVSSILAKKSEKDASFGFIAFSSIGPVIAVLLLALFSNTQKMSYTLSDYSVQDNFAVGYGYALLEQLLAVGESVGILLVCFLVVNFTILKLDKTHLLNLLKGVLLVYLGLVLFLAAVEAVYMGVGYKVGSELSSSPIAVILILAFVIGALTVLAEPAIKVLVSQVEETTNGIIKKRSLLIALALGVGCAIMLAMLRIVYQFSILYILVPGYIVCFVLSFFIPKIYTAIAFDAGGVASGPLTSSFILPMALGLCSSLCDPDQILNYGFGVVALVALSPLISIEILGVAFSVLEKRRSSRAIKKALKEGDEIIIHFGGTNENKSKTH